MPTATAFSAASSSRLGASSGLVPTTAGQAFFTSTRTGTGAIDHQEFKQGLEEIFTTLDKNKDGVIDRSELLFEQGLPEMRKPNQGGNNGGMRTHGRGGRRGGGQGGQQGGQGQDSGQSQDGQ